MVVTVQTRWVHPDELRTHADLALFPMGNSELKAITESMRAAGYDQSQPIVVWQRQGYIVDGHTRHAAAKAAGLTEVLIHEQPFEDWDAALDYAIARQRDRRNVSRHDLISYIAHVVRSKDNLKRAGRPPEKLAARAANSSGKSADDLASKIGVSGDTVERVRAVLNATDEDVAPVRDQLLAGEIAPRTAYNEVRRIEAVKADSAPLATAAATNGHSAPADPPALTLISLPAAPKVHTAYSLEQWAAMDAAAREDAIALGRITEAPLNKQETDNIEWAKWSWNPLTGCLHNCPYCYARDIANRFYAQKFAPTFLPWRLGAPATQRVPSQAESELGYRNIFTCSMADLFGKWVPADWIEAVLGVARDNPQWNFLFLTKFPNRLAEFEYPDNAWLGTSVDCQARVKNAERSFSRVRGGVKWLSIEPMLEPLRFESLSMFDWVVVGGASASTETPAWLPPRRWVLDLECQAREAGAMIYEKTNLGINGPSRFREYPGWERATPALPTSLAYLPTIGQGD